MRILFISNDLPSVDVLRNALSSIAEKDSIFFVHSFYEAQEYINKRIVGEQLPLDLIISHNKISGEIALDFKNTLISDQKRIYSNYDFNLYKIPIILLINSVENRRLYDRQGFSSVLLDFGAEKLVNYIDNFQKEIKSWRKQVIDELDNLGIKFNSGQVDYEYYFTKAKRYVPTEILSENFQTIPRKLNYYWLTNNQRQIEIAIDEFIKLLKRTHRDNRKREEKLYHQFFNRNLFFLLRDNYSKSWYEQELPYGKNRYYEPDYSLKPNMNYHTDLNILEVKLPNEGFVKKKDFHPNLYHRVYEHLGQINDYKEYLENEEFREIIKKIYGSYPKKIQYNLLMGRQSDKEENQETINKRMRQNRQDIYLMTYDELLEYQVRYLDRLNFLNVL